MKLYRVKDVCEILNISRPTLHKWIKQGKIKVVVLPNGQRRIPESEVNKLLKEMKSGPQAVTRIDIVSLIIKDFRKF